MNKRDEAVLASFDEEFGRHYEKAVSGGNYFSSNMVSEHDLKQWFLQKLQEERERIIGEVEKLEPGVYGKEDLLRAINHQK